MRTVIAVTLGLLFVLPADAQIKRQERRSLLDSDPEVVYLETVFDEPLELTVTREVPVFSDKKASQRLGFLREGQKVQLEAITERAFRVRGDGSRGSASGWAAPTAFETSKDPDLVANMKKLYERQMAVQSYINAQDVAVGMTLDEVTKSKGKPDKTSVRRTSERESGRWEYVEYDEVKHYVTRVDPGSGQIFRQLSHVTREEKNKTVVEFEDGVVTAVEESEDRHGGAVRIVVPPLLFRW